jgi:dolichol-phosphate mannosyltransferase
MLSVVIPVFNEADSLDALHAELRAVATAEGYQLDVVLVDDGSTDGSWEVIARLAQSDPQVRGIRFRRNFGKAAALNAGLAEARGELVMTLDADLQDDPREIPRFLAAMATDLDVVSGWKKVRHDPPGKVAASRLFNAVVSRVTGVWLHDHNCGMKCYRREIFDDLTLYGELHRFVPVLAAARGYRIGEVVVNHRPRRFGRSKYGAGRILKGFLDLVTVKFLTTFAQRPQHALGSVGLITSLLGLLGLAYAALAWTVARVFPAAAGLMPHDGLTILCGAALLVLGGQWMLIGLLAELLVAQRAPGVKGYWISQRTAPSQAALPHEENNPPAVKP